MLPAQSVVRSWCYKIISVGAAALQYSKTPQVQPIQTIIFISKWGTEGTGDGEFDWPSGVAMASDGSVYVADWRNSRIQKFTSEGVFVTKWGTYGIAAAADGSVYVSDSGNRRIQKFSVGQ
jgi:DNA-binding beta-propeller fold protein YncE